MIIISSIQRDWVTTLPELREKAREYSNLEWNTFDGDTGDTLVKLLAVAADTVDFYVNMYMNHLYLPNDSYYAKSMIWELLGYKPPYQSASKLYIRLDWPDCGIEEYLYIAKYTKVKVTTDDGEYDFIVAKDYLIPPLTRYLAMAIVQGTFVEVDLDIHEKLEENKYKLSDDVIDYSYVSVIVSEHEWTQVRTIFYEDDKTHKYSLNREEDGVYLYLPENWQDQVDEYKPTFKIIYLESDFSFAESTKNCIGIKLEDKILLSDGTDITDIFRIHLLDVLDYNDPDFVETLDVSTLSARAITLDDYTREALNYPSVALSRAYDYQTPDIVSEPLEVKVLACNYLGKLTSVLGTGLYSYLKSIGTRNLVVTLEEPVQKVVDLFLIVDIGKYKDTPAVAEIKLNIDNTLKDLFKIGRRHIGLDLDLLYIKSQILNCDSRISGLDWSTVDNSLAYNQFPILGKVVYIFDAQNTSIYDAVISYDNSFIGQSSIDFSEKFEEKTKIDVEYDLFERIPLNATLMFTYKEIISKELGNGIDKKLYAGDYVFLHLLEELFINSFFELYQEDAAGVGRLVITNDSGLFKEVIDTGSLDKNFKFISNIKLDLVAKLSKDIEQVMIAEASNFDDSISIVSDFDSKSSTNLKNEVRYIMVGDSGKVKGGLG